LKRVSDADHDGATLRGNRSKHSIVIPTTLAKSMPLLVEGDERRKNDIVALHRHRLAVKWLLNAKRPAHGLHLGAPREELQMLANNTRHGDECSRLFKYPQRSINVDLPADSAVPGDDFG